MEYQEHYENMVERNNLCKIAIGKGFRMLHDNFDGGWKRGDEPKGTLIFTDEPAPKAPTPIPPRDYGAEIDELRQDNILLRAEMKGLKKVNGV